MWQRGMRSHPFLDEYCANNMICFDYLNVRAIAPARDSRDASMVGGMPF